MKPIYRLPAALLTAICVLASAGVFSLLTTLIRAIGGQK